MIYGWCPLLSVNLCSDCHYYTRSFDLVDHYWKRLPDCPKPFLQNALNIPLAFLYIRMKVFKSRAYVFTGFKDILFFDLEKQVWGMILTIYADSGTKPWPYEINVAQNYCMEIFEEKIYIIGGEIERIGKTINDPSNIVMMLDIERKEWRHLGGDFSLWVNMTRPQVRSGASSWLVPEQRKIFMLYGNFPRFKYSSLPEVYSRIEWIYDDMWSFDIDNHKWHRECIQGNFPVPRTGCAHAYNPRSGTFVLYGGRNGVPTYNKNGRFPINSYSCLGDTFVLDVKTNIWKQVLTREFPAYRHLASCAADENTGAVYLFGG